MVIYYDRVERVQLLHVGGSVTSNVRVITGVNR